MAGKDLGEELFGTPATPAEAPDLGAELFGAPPAAPKKAASTSTPNPFKQSAPAQEDFTSYDPMGGDLGAEIMGVSKPNVGVMEGVPPAPVQTPSKAPLRPEVRRAIEAKYDAASPAERIMMEVTTPGAVGDVIRQRAQEYDRAKKLPPTARRLAPSAEARAERLVEKGEKPEFAEVAGQEAAAAGVTPGKEVQFMQREGVVEPTEFDFEMFDKYRNANPLLRAGVAGYERYKQGALGVNQAVADLLGFEDFARTQAAGAKESRAAVESMGENPNYLARQFEGAVGSIAQQLPATIGGVISGSEAFVLGSMFLQSFGQEYSEGKSKGLDGPEAATRAGLFGAFEVIGERFGLKFELDNLRRAASGIKTDALPAFLGNVLKRELPGEYLTTTGQFLTDKSAIGLNQNATLEDYLKQLADTTVQTVIQSGLMTGGTKALEKGVGMLSERGVQEEPIPTAEQLMRERGFLRPTTRPTQQIVQEPSGRIEPTLEAQQLTPESVLQQIGALSQEAFGGNHPAVPEISLADGTFAGSGTLNMDANGNVVLTRVADNEDHLGKNWTDVGQDEMLATSLTHGGGRGLPTSGMAGWERSFGAARQGRVVGTFRIPAAQLLQAIRDGNAVLGNVGEGEIVLNPSFAKQFLSEIDGKPLVALQGRVEPTLEPVAAVADRQTRVDEIATRLVETAGVDPTDAIKIAEGRIRAEEALEQKRQDQMQEEVAGRTTLVKPAENRVQEITDDLIGAGMHPTEAAQRAVMMAQQEAEDDAQAEEEGVPDVRALIAETSGAGTELPSAGAAGVPTGGVAETVPTGLVPTGAAVGEPAEGEAVQPRALTLEERAGVRAALAESLDQQGVSEDEKAGVLQRFDERTQRQQEEARGLETPEAIEAEAQGEEVLGEAPAPRKRGRPTLAPEQRTISEQRREQQRVAYKAVDKQVSNAERMLAEAAEPVDEAGAKDDAQLREMYDNKRTQRNAAIRTLYDIAKTNKGKPGQRAQALLDQHASPVDIRNAAEGHALRKQLGQILTTNIPSKAIEAAAAQSTPDAKLGKATNGAQALTQIIKTGNDFQKSLAKRLRGFVANVKVVVVEANQPTPEGITKNARYARDWERARAMYVENYKTGERVVYVRGASFGESQGVNNITMLHELLHAALNRKIAIGRNDLEMGKRSETARLLGDLVQIMNNAGDRFNELASQGKLPPHISKLAQFGEIFDDPREFVAYGMTDPAFQDFLKTARGIGISQPFYTRFVDLVRKFFGMDELDSNALADLIEVTDSILTTKAPRAAAEEVEPSMMALFGDLFGKKPDETQAFAGQTIAAKPSANAKRLAALLGAKLYGEPTGIAKVSVKELFQNAFDAIKGAIENGQLKEGKINIKLDDKNRTITITDNGLGMPASVMGNEFLQIAGTVKETERASGGLGIAKMLFLFGNEKLEIVSLRNGVVARMVTTGVEVMEALDDPSKSPTITTSSDPATVKTYKETLFPDGHGTTVVVKIPPTFTDPSTGEVRDIPFYTSSLANSDSLEYSPLFDNIEVTVDTGYGPRELPIGKNFPIDDYTSFANVNFAWGTARIYVTKNEVDGYGDNTHILSNGLWQFDKSIKDGPGWTAKRIKRTFYVDVSPKVKPEEAGYPFELNRQGFAPAISEDFNKIFKYISVIYQQQTLAGESKSFGAIQYVNPNGTLTKPEQLEPKAPPTPTAFTLIKPDDKVEVIDGVMYVNGRETPELSDEDLKNATIKIDELTIPQDEIDTDRVMVHDNTLVKGGEAAAKKSLSEAAREKFGSDYDKYLVGIGDIFMQMRNALSTEDNGRYTDIRKEAIGLSLDKEYYGVSIRVPFSGMYLNPATTSLKGTSRQIAVSMIGTMIHEMAHHKIRGHDADFASEMQRIMNLLETHQNYDLAEAKKQLTNHIQKYINVFDFLDKEFSSGNLEPRGNRFQDAGSYQARNEGTVGTVEGARAAGEEPGSGVPGGTEPSYQRIEPVGVSTGAAGKAEEAGEQQEAVRSQGEINREVDIALEKVRIGRQAEEAARQSKILQALRDPRKILPALRQVWKGATYAQRIALVKLPTTEFLARWGGSYIPELMNTNVLLEKMGGLTQQLLDASAVLTQTIHKAFKEDKTLRKKLEDVAYTSTIAEIDPSDPDAEERSPKLDKMYQDLGPKGQQMYKLILAHYQNMADYFAQLLDDQIANARLTVEAQNQLMSLVRKMYETGQKIKPYVPLVRRGDFWLAVGSGKHRQFFTFESMAERDAAAEEFARERRTPLEQLKEDQDFVLGNDIGSLRRASFDSSTILKSLFDVIDGQDFSDPGVREELKDSIYQLYLTSMPEQSFRKQFINRKNITGFSTDLLRNVSTVGVKMATQLSKIKYAPLLRNSLSAAQDSIVGREELQPFITEMQARVNQQLNPGQRTASDRVGDFLNRSAFLWYLSGASSALIQPLGVFQTGAPILMSRYGQINGARELTKMLKVWNQYGVWRKNPDGSVSFVPPSVVNATGLTPDEKRAIREALGRDVTQSTYASAMFGYKSTPTEQLGGAWNLTKRGAAMATGGLMHTTERLSREMLFMASYRLNRQAGKTHEEAVNQAVIDTNEALGNYGQYNRPLVMQKGLGKVALQFTMYPLHVTLFLMRNFKRMLPLLNKEGKWEASKTFFGTLGTTMVLAGASGLPMFSIVMGILGAMWRDEDKPQQFKDVDFETWWRTVWLPQTLGHIEIGGKKLSDIVDRGVANALTGLDISSRTSLNDLWLRDTKETKTARESAIALAMEKAGPSASMILSLADAYEAFGNGDYQKGIEKMSPAVIRNFILTHKYATEGATNNEGAQLLLKGDYTTGMLLGQAIGFRADELSEPQKLGFKLNAAVQRVKIERSKILNNLYREYRSGEKSGKWDGYLKQLELMNKFNVKYPNDPITDEQLLESFERRMEQRGIHEAWAGMPIEEKYVPLIGEPALKAVKDRERRQKKE